MTIVSIPILGASVDANPISKVVEPFWENLLDFIEDGRVIPVLGPELLTLDNDGEPKLLYSHLAQQLAARLQVDYQPKDSLNGVVCRYLAQRGEREDVYSQLKRAMPPLNEIKLPTTLTKLAEIRPLKLFVSTSFDPLLTHALNKVRYGGQEKTQTLDFFPGGTISDLPTAPDRLEYATVFHLFGKLSTVPEYAVTDEDILEFMHTLQDKSSRPEKLFDALNKQYLMIIGCPFSDWLARFFIRICKNERLVIASGKTDFWAGDQLQSETGLTEFLRSFSRRTKLFPLNSVEFIDELHRRWLLKHPETGQTKTAGITIDQHPDKMPRGAVFLSYASEDRPAVRQLRDALEQAGIDVWFDRNPDALQAGDDFDAVIKANIQQCSLFIPVISQNTRIPAPRFFRTEWNLAQAKAERLPPNLKFIITVTIDDTPPDAPEIPEKFRSLHWGRLPGGAADEAFVSHVKELYRNYQRTLAQPA